jgi:hypothetical protein
MQIKKTFSLLKGTPNILDMSKSQIESLTLEGNSSKHVFVSLELKKNVIRHFALDKILDYVKNVKTTNDMSVIVNEQYPLVVSYSHKAHSKIINIVPFNAKDLARVSYMNLYASVLYAYTFDSLINGRLRIPDNMVKVISNFWFSLFVRMFGRAYGMTGTYSSKLPGLKFLITAYLLIAFFGRKQDNAVYKAAKQYSGFSYEDNVDILNKIDMSDFRGFIKSLTLMEIMPGFNIIKFTVAIHRIFDDVQILPGFEDLSRFMSLVMISSVPQQTIVKPVFRKYNVEAHSDILNYIKGRLF